MSWITERPGGHKWLGFRRGGKQHTIRLGKSDRKTAERSLQLLDRLISTIDQGLDPDPELRGWLERMGDTPRQAIATAGLADKRGVRTVGALCRRYLEALEEREADGYAKRSTLDNARVAVANLLVFWRDDQSLRLIDREDCEAFRRWLRKDGRVNSDDPLAETTVSRQCRRGREIFGIAVEAGWIERNPWKGMKGFRERDTGRDLYVPREVVEHVIDATADLELRLALAIARYCGVRGPSEIQRLKLTDVDVERKTIRFEVPKLEHLEGHGERLCPLWPEVEVHARAIYDRAIVGQTLALPNLSAITDTALTGRIKRAVQAAGVTPWQKPFVNLRASCERDLFKAHPIDDVCAWLGHSPLVALKHYSRAAKVVAAESATTASGLPSNASTVRSSIPARVVNPERT